jgi:hypothetical protein
MCEGGRILHEQGAEAYSEWQSTQTCVSLEHLLEEVLRETADDHSP